MKEEDADLSMRASRPLANCRRPPYFSSSDSFAMIRGGHIDLTVLGAMEIAENGDMPTGCRKNDQGMGGAMDLVAGVKKIIVSDGAHVQEWRSQNSFRPAPCR